MKNMWTELRKLRARLHNTATGYSLEELMRMRKRELIHLNVIRARLGVWKERAAQGIH